MFDKFNNYPNPRFPKKPNIPKILFVRKDQIFAEIEAQLQILAESRLAENGQPNKTLNGGAERFASQFERWIDKYLDLAKSRMAAYVVEVQRKATINAHRDWDEATIHLSFPATWNHTTFEQLGDAVQNYIVNSCLYEFLCLSLTSKDPVTIDKMTLAEDANSMIKHCCVSSLPGTQRKKLKPF